jgi:hypothetical protein
LFASPEKLDIPRNKNELMLDSGAYDFIIKQKNETYPYTPDTYFETVRSKIQNDKIKLDYLVSMDYICSPQDKKGNRVRIDRNVQNTIHLSKIFEKEQPDFKLIPVVQGYELEEYIYCLKQLHKNNILESHSYIGIGSIANRKKSTDAQKIVLGVIKCLDNEIGFKNYKFHLNDNLDVLFLATAVPYTDIVVTERTWRHRIQKMKLDTKYDTIMLNNIDDLLNLEPEKI